MEARAGVNSLIALIITAAASPGGHVMISGINGAVNLVQRKKLLLTNQLQLSKDKFLLEKIGNSTYEVI